MATKRIPAVTRCVLAELDRDREDHWSGGLNGQDDGLSSDPAIFGAIVSILPLPTSSRLTGIHHVLSRATKGPIVFLGDISRVA